MIDLATFDRIKNKYGACASWAVWAEQSVGPKSGIGDLSVLDPDLNPRLLETLHNDVVMLGLNLSRSVPPPLGNFHDRSSKGQDFKLRFAFTGTPYYGAYMTDLIKEIVMLKSGDLMRHLAHDPPLVTRNVDKLLGEFEDLRSEAPTLIAFGADVYRITRDYVPAGRYSRLVKVRHYSDYSKSKEQYREEVLADLAAVR